MASTPAPSALRMIAPKFPGFTMPSKINNVLSSLSSSVDKYISLASDSAISPSGPSL